MKVNLEHFPLFHLSSISSHYKNFLVPYRSSFSVPVHHAVLKYVTYCKYGFFIVIYSFSTHVIKEHIKGASPKADNTLSYCTLPGSCHTIPGITFNVQSEIALGNDWILPSIKQNRMHQFLVFHLNHLMNLLYKINSFFLKENNQPWINTTSHHL